MITGAKMNRPQASSNPIPGENVVDLEEIVKVWAQEVFDISKTKEQTRIPKEMLQYNINWKYVKFHFDEPHYDVVPHTINGNEVHKPKFQPQVLFKTHYTNNTAFEQEYMFKTERTTRSSCTVCVESGFTRGFEFALKLATPCEIAEANAGFKREIAVVNIGEDSVEEQLTWGVDSTIKVPAHTETTAELVIKEAQQSHDFLMETRFHGRVLVTVTDLRDNNNLVTHMEGDISQIMRREIQRGLKGFRIDRERVVVAETRGRCSFKYGVEQRVKIYQQPAGSFDYVDS
uniref:Vitellogenin n=1 Tax=Romanomermis culicivorax TaxID=13658 RepID=A0A915J078_ROMCU